MVAAVTTRTPGQEQAAQLRAAIGYSGMTFAALADLTGLRVDVLKKAAAREYPIELDAAALQAIADACEVPLWFLRGGWGGAWMAPRPTLTDEEVAIVQKILNGDPLPPGEAELWQEVSRKVTQGYVAPGAIPPQIVRDLTFEAVHVAGAEPAAPRIRPEG